MTHCTGLNNAPPPEVHLELQNGTLFGNRVFADVVKMRSCWITVDPNPMTGLLTRRESRDEETHL